MSAYYYDAPPAPQLIGVGELGSPGAAIYRLLGERRVLQAAGQTSSSVGAVDPAASGAGLGIGIGMIAALVAVAVAINYQIGKAMAPSKDVEARWAWGNAIGGTVFPPYTIISAIYKNYLRR